MSLPEILAIFAAGLAAGTINTIVGSGSLVTFPTLLFLGFPPLTANVSNNIGIVGGGLTGSWGYRRELKGASSTLKRLVPMSFAGSVVGACLLLVLPAAAFSTIVPLLIVIAIVLLLAGPRLQRMAAARHTARGGAATAPRWHGVAMQAGVFVAGVYGGYFGAAQGVLLMGILSVLSLEPLQRLNGYKNVLALVVNVVAAVLFILVAPEAIYWRVVLILAVGAALGGLVGARVGRRLPPAALRGVIVVIGIVAIVKLVVFP